MRKNDFNPLRQPSGITQGVPLEATPALRSLPWRVRHDGRGTAVWNWDVATGVLAGSKASELLRMLDDPALAIAGDYGPDVDWAGDPYNRSR